MLDVMCNNVKSAHKYFFCGEGWKIVLTIILVFLLHIYIQAGLDLNFTLEFYIKGKCEYGLFYIICKLFMENVKRVFMHKFELKLLMVFNYV